MRLKVLNPFRDKDNFLILHNVGETIEVDETRGETLLSLNLAEKEGEQPEEAAPASEISEEEKTEVAEVEVAEEKSEEEQAEAPEEKVVRKRKSRK